MKIRIIAIGGKMPSWVTAGYTEYSKRLPADFRLELVELPLGKRGKNTDRKRAIKQEAEQMLAAIATNERVIALEVEGKSWTTEQLAQQINNWRMEGQSLCILIGGPDGLDSSCSERAEYSWSLSALTLPHTLVRIVLAEQLYRAWSIIQHHPYHK